MFAEKFYPLHLNFLFIIPLLSFLDPTTTEQTLSVYSYEGGEFFTGFNINPNYNDPQYSYCAEVSILGGYCKVNQDSEISKEVQNLRPHYAYTITATFYFLDDFSSSGFTINDLTHTFNIGEITIPTVANNQCGDPAKSEQIKAFSTTVTHSETFVKLTFKAVKFLDSYHPQICEANWGIRKISLTLSLCDNTCKSCSGSQTNQCLSCWENGVLSSNSCTCPTNYLFYFDSACTNPSSCGKCVQCPNGYLDSTGNCKNCDSTCSTCVGAGTTDCLTCSSTYSFLTVISTSTNTGSCSKFCPSDYYANAKKKICFLGDKPSQRYETIFSHFFETSFSGTNYLSGLGWTYNTDSQPITVCADNSIVGGYSYFGTGKTLSKTVNTPSPHYKALLTMKLYLLDSWDSENFDLKVDNVLAYTIIFEFQWLNSPPSTCANTLFPDKIFVYKVFFDHSSSALALQMSSNLDSPGTDESWGIREVTLELLLCDATCLSCSGKLSTECLTCYTGSFLYQGSCYNPCPSGTYNPTGSTVCQICQSICKTCDGALTTNCLSCSSPKFLKNKECVDACGDGYYSDSTLQTCVACGIANCKVCSNSGGTNSNIICTTCATNYYFDINSCLTTCPDGKYGSISNTGIKICYSCHYSCNTCSGALDNNCLSCHFGDFLKLGFCLSTCGDGFYGLSGVCHECGLNNCFSCDVDYTLSIICNKCNDRFYLDADACVSSCSGSKYPGLQDSVNKCLSCHSICSTCSGGTNLDCLSCPSGTFLKSNQCLGSCGLTFYADSALWICSSCNIANCDICEKSPTLAIECKKCGDSYFLNENTCLTECPSRLFSDTNLNGYKICSKCDQNCDNCNGPLNSNCLSCTNGLHLKSGTCVDNCGEGFLLTISSNICTSCGIGSCSECQAAVATEVVPGVLIKCTKCLSNLKLNDNSCVDICPVGRYTDYTVVPTCQICHINCLTCDGPLENNCLTCPSTSFLKNFQCMSSCGNSYYVIHDNVCAECGIDNCSVCQIQVDTKICTKCFDGYFLNQITCTKICPSGKYPNLNAAVPICSDCNINCLTCDGPEYNNCLTCAGSSLKSLLKNYECVENCGDGYYISPTSINLCLSCGITHCKTCSENTKILCQACMSSYFLLANECLATCPAGYFQNSINQISLCSQCDSSCLSCDGLTSNDCLSCKTGSFLKSRQCLSSCGQGFFQDTNQNVCISCGVNFCVACSFLLTSLICTECAAPYFLSGNTCPESCPTIGKFPTLDRLCKDCDTTCYTCTGASSSSCVQCKGNLFLKSGYCLTDCGSGFYGDLSDNLCKICGITGCNKCSVPSNGINACYECMVGLFLYSGICESTCPSKTFATTANSINICQNCDGTCLTCSGATNGDCLSCSQGLFLLSKSCKSSCGLGYYGNPVNNICTSCPIASCEQCSLDLSQNVICEWCLSTFYLYNQKCYTSCPEKTYSNINTSNGKKICSLCHDSCLTCSGPTNTNCVTCPTTSFLHLGNQCLVTCPVKYYGDSTTKKCVACYSTCYTCNGTTSLSCLSCAAPYSLSTKSCVLTCPTWYISYNQVCLKCLGYCGTCLPDNLAYCLTCRFPTYQMDLTGPFPKCLIYCKEGMIMDKRNNTCVSALEIPSSTRTLSHDFFENSFSMDNVNAWKWTSTRVINTQLVYTCNDKTIFGGYNILGGDDYVYKLVTLPSDLQPCYALYLSIAVYLIDDWSTFNMVQFLINGFGGNLLQINGTRWNDSMICGHPSYTDKIFEIRMVMNPPDSTIKSYNFTFFFYNTLTRDFASWGFRNFSLIALLCDSSCLTCKGPKINDCITCYNSKPLITGGYCKCPDGYFKNELTNTCEACPDKCKNCLKNNIFSCTGCLSNFFFLVVDITTQSGSCLEGCPSGYVVSKETYLCLSIEPSTTQTKLFTSDNFPPGSDNSYVADNNYTVSGSSTAVLNYINTCGTYSLLGGYLVLSKSSKVKKQLMLNPHYALYIKLSLVFIDEWLIGDYIYIYFNSQLTYAVEPAHLAEKISICGDNSIADFLYEVKLYIPNSQNQIDIDFEPSSPRETENFYWGLASFSVLEYLCKELCSVCIDPQGCRFCVDGAYLVDNYWCSWGSCPSGYFQPNPSYEICSKCLVKNCPKCLQLNSCEECESGYLLLNQGDVFCLRTCPPGFIADLDKKLCLPINSYNEETSGINLLADFFNETLAKGIEKWEISMSSSDSPVFTSCCGLEFTEIVGGFNSFGDKFTSMITTINTGDPHYKVIFSAKIFIIDDWNINDQVNINIDGLEVYSFTFDEKFSVLSLVNYCGSQDKFDQIFEMKMLFTHKDPFLKLGFHSNLDKSPDVKSWGIREINITVLNCHVSCASCSSFEENKCLNCRNGLYYLLGTCVPSCPLNHILDGTGKVCLPCHETCASCVGLNPDQCSSCPKEKKFMYVSNLLAKTGQCLEFCSSNLITVLSNQICVEKSQILWTSSILSRSLFQPCLNEESTVLEPEWTLESSAIPEMLCSGIYFAGKFSISKLTASLDMLNVKPYFALIISYQILFIQNEWVQTGISTMLNDYPSFLIKKPQSFRLNLCEGDSKIETFVVSLLFYHEKFEKLQISFLSNEPDPNQISLWALRDFQVIHFACNEFCAACRGPAEDDCLSCLPGRFLLEGRCPGKCPEIGFFPDAESRTCKRCHGDCRTCSDFGEMRCTTCNEIFLTFKVFENEGSTTFGCKPQCPSLYLADLDSVICLLNYKSYETAKRTAVFRDFANNSTDNVVNGWTSSGLSSSCFTSFCDSQTIAGGYGVFGLNDSLEKLNTDLLPHYSLLFRVRVYAIDEWSAIDSLTLVLGNSHNYNMQFPQRDMSLCGSAEASDTKYDILIFFNHSDTYLSITFQSDLCSKDREEKSWGISAVTLELYVCDKSCQSCNGPELNQCLSCGELRYLLNSTCLKKCPDTYFENKENNICSKCHPSCLRCSGPEISNCTLCNNGIYMNIFNNTCVSKCLTPLVHNDENMSCIANCGASRYLDKSINTCKSCNPSCLECEGPYATSCLNCHESLFFNPSKKRCDSQKVCGDGEFVEGEICDSVNGCSDKCVAQMGFACKNNECFNCNQETCLACRFEDRDHCTLCQERQLLDPGTGKCLPCGEYCEGCESSTDKCTSCQTGTVLIEGKCIKVECQVGFHISDDNKSCEECFERCQACFKAGSDGCLKCKSDYVLRDNACNRCDETPGFKIIQKNPPKCQEICGKGERLTTDLECDDGNLRNGDGCSSNCRVERGWICNKTSGVKVDICKKVEKPRMNINKDRTEDTYSSSPDNNDLTIIINRFEKEYILEFVFSEKVRAKVALNEVFSVEIKNYNRSNYNYTLIIRNDTSSAYRLLQESSDRASSQSFDVIDVKFELQETMRDKSISVNVKNGSLTDLYDNSLQQSDYDESLPLAIFYSEGLRKAAELVSAATQGMQLSVATAVPPVVIAGGARLVFGLVDVSQYLYFLLYVNVNYPLNAEKFLEVFGAFNLDFMPNLMTIKYKGISLAKELQLEKLQSPKKFYQNDKDAMFLRNGSQAMSTFLMFGFFYILVLLLVRMSRQFAFLRNTAHNLRRYLEWGAFYRTFFTTYLDLAFAINLQFTNLEIDKIDVVVSLSIAAACFVYYIGLPLAVFWKLRSLRNESDSPETVEKFGTLYMEFHNRNSVSYFFMVIVLFRKFFFSLALVFLYYQPLFVLCSLLIISIMYTLLLIKYKPYRVVFENYKNIMSDILYVGVLITILLFVDDQMLAEDTRLKVGWTMIVISMILLGVHMIGLIYMQYLGFRKGYFWFRKRLTTYRKSLAKPQFKDFSKAKIIDAKGMFVKTRFPPPNIKEGPILEASTQNSFDIKGQNIYLDSPLTPTTSSKVLSLANLRSYKRGDERSGLQETDSRGILGASARHQNFFPDMQETPVKITAGSAFRGRYLEETGRKKF